MPRRPSLTHRQIATAALGVIDRDGLGALTMRAVAEQLGVGTMSLYRYVDSREQLEGLIVDLVLGAVDTSPPDPPWTHAVTVLTTRVYDAVAAHPAVIPLVLTTRGQAVEGLTRYAEAVLAALTDGGFTGRERAIAFRTLMSHVIGAVQMEHLGALAGPGTAGLEAAADRPLLSETARAARDIGSGEEFRSGLAVVVRGLAATAPARR